MKWLLLYGLVAHAAETIDYGDLKQYNSRLTSPPSLSGETFWLSGTDDVGYDIVLSPSTHSKVKDVFSSCGDDHNKCFTDALNVLEHATIEVDNKLSKRAFRHMISKTMKTGTKEVATSPWTFFLSTIELLKAKWKANYDEIPNLHLGSSAAAQAVEAAGAAEIGQAKDIVISIGGSAVATITAPPLITPTVTGSVAPQVTTAKVDENGHKKGDLLALMDAEFAMRLNDYLAMTSGQDCEDGINFDAEHPSKKRASVSMGKAICAAESVIKGAGKGDPFGDIALLKHDQMGIAIKDTAGNAKDALVVVKDFVIAYAPLLAIPGELIDQIATYVLALAIDQVIQGVKLGVETLLDSGIWELDEEPSKPEPSATTSSKVGCPDATATPLLCGWEDESDCTLKAPAKDAQQVISGEPTCKDGEFQNCPCNAPASERSYGMTEEAFGTMQFFTDILKATTEGNRNAQCSKESSGVQLKYWLSLYPKFCEEVKKDPSEYLKKTYANSEIKPQKRSYPIDKRTPPVYPDAYKNVEFEFEWSGGTCTTSCEDTYYDLGQGECGGYNNIMQAFGHKDLNCGVYGYSIAETGAKVACRSKDYLASRNTKEGTSLETAIQQWCTDNDSKMVKKGDNMYQRYGITQYGVPGRASFWLRGAITCGEQETMKKDDCIKALQKGLDKCAAGNGLTSGLAASVGCLDYSIDVSGVTRDDSPPWDQIVAFPPPEDAISPLGVPHEVVCGEKTITSLRIVSEAEMNKAIDAFCKDGGEIRGFGFRDLYYDYMFSWRTGKMIFGTILNSNPMSATNDKRNWKPYKDMRWCDNYDWKMGKDDCTMALRKMYRKCNVDSARDGADFTYRCVRYHWGYVT